MERMKVIIAGSRDYTDKTEFLKIMDYIQTVIEHGQMEPITEIISGHAKGVDQLGEQYARMHQIPIQIFLPNWDKEGKKAGPIRNREMAIYASQDPNGTLIVFWDGKSKGTKSMIDYARKANLNRFIYYYKERRLAQEWTKT